MASDERREQFDRLVSELTLPDMSFLNQGYSHVVQSLTDIRVAIDSFKNQLGELLLGLTTNNTLLQPASSLNALEEGLENSQRILNQMHQLCKDTMGKTRDLGSFYKTSVRTYLEDMGETDLRSALDKNIGELQKICYEMRGLNDHCQDILDIQQVEKMRLNGEVPPYSGPPASSL